jgi:hypothetical protein
MDLMDQRTIDIAQAEAVATELGGMYCEVSAKSGEGVYGLLIRIAEECLKRIRGTRAPPVSASGAVDLGPDNPAPKVKKKKTFC